MNVWEVVIPKSPRAEVGLCNTQQKKLVFWSWFGDWGFSGFCGFAGLGALSKILLVVRGGIVRLSNSDTDALAAATVEGQTRGVCVHDHLGNRVLAKGFKCSYHDKETV